MALSRRMCDPSGPGGAGHEWSPSLENGGGRGQVLGSCSQFRGLEGRQDSWLQLSWGVKGRRGAEAGASMDLPE